MLRQNLVKVLALIGLAGLVPTAVGCSNGGGQPPASPSPQVSPSASPATVTPDVWAREFCQKVTSGSPNRAVAKEAQRTFEAVATKETLNPTAGVVLSQLTHPDFVKQVPKEDAAKPDDAFMQDCTRGVGAFLEKLVEPQELLPSIPKTAFDPSRVNVRQALLSHLPSARGFRV
jgi:hypothetical protein